MLPAAFTDALAHRPRLHERSPLGAWGIGDLASYELLAAHVGPTSVTFETGLGMTTILLAMLGATHTSVFLGEHEGGELTRWAEEFGVDLSRVELVTGASRDVLPTLAPRELDLYIIDGGHGYPTPQLDWVYGAPWLRKGGVLFVDDTQLWAPAQLDAFLAVDPRWEEIARGEKWSAYRRLDEGDVLEDSFDQEFLPRRSLEPPPPRVASRAYDALARHAPEPLRVVKRRAVRAFERWHAARTMEP